MESGLKDEDVLNLYEIKAFAKEASDEELQDRADRLLDEYFKDLAFDPYIESVDEEYLEPVSISTIRERYKEREEWLDPDDDSEVQIRGKENTQDAFLLSYRGRVVL